MTVSMDGDCSGSDVGGERLVDRIVQCTATCYMLPFRRRRRCIVRTEVNTGVHGWGAGLEGERIR